jgi:phosphatidylserine/phosphatidylglycerophosphate/cardiolipin synthase-like enzyme
MTENHLPGLRTLQRRLKLTRVGAGPWRDGNGFELLSDGAEFFPRMVAAIDAARERVALEMYLVQSGTVAERFVDALVRAASRGVPVYVLLDDFGSRGLHTADRRRLFDAGIEVRFYNVLGWRKRLGNFLRDHRKLLAVDGRLAFVGGAGLTDDFVPHTHRSGPWHDLMVAIEGPVTRDWERLFAATWRASGGRWPQESLASDAAVALPVLPALPSVLRPAAPAPASTSPRNGARGRVVASGGLQVSSLASSVMARVTAARHRVWVVSAYFVPSRRLRRVLRRAARRGVDVRLLTPGPLTDHPLVRLAAHRHYGRMLRHGVHVFEYQPRMLHAKMVICDDWVSIGSSNLDRWSFTWNLEANQEVADGEFASQAAALFRRDCAEALELDGASWRHRGWRRRWHEYLVGFVDRFLARWQRPRP